MNGHKKPWNGLQNRRENINQLILTDKVGFVRKAYQMTRPAHDINQIVDLL